MVMAPLPAPLLLPGLPWLAFAGDLLYLEIFPPD